METTPKKSSPLPHPQSILSSIVWWCFKHPSEWGIEFFQTPPLFNLFPMIPGKHLLGIISRSIKEKQSEQVYILGKALSNGLLLELGPAHGLNLPQVGPYPGKGLQPGVDPTLFVLLWGEISLLQIQ